MIAVIGIIGILVSSLILTFNKAKAQARQTDCKSNLRQFGVAVLIYRSDHSSQNPAWLSCLYPEYVDDQRLYVCRSDPNHGTGTAYPAELPALSSTYTQTPVDDNDNNNSVRVPLNCNQNIRACSYFYEFSVVPSPWSTLTPTLDSRNIKNVEPFARYCDFKNAQRQYGDQANVNLDGSYKPYSDSRMPIIRCFNHIHEGHIPGYANQGFMQSGRITNEKITLNVAYAGNVYVGPVWWEGTLQPGDTNNVVH